MLNTLFKIIKREFKHFFTTPIAVMIMFGGPLVFGIIIGLVYTNAKPTKLPIMVVDKDRTILSESFVDALNDNQYLKVISVSPDDKAAFESLRTMKVEGVVTIPEHFEGDIQQKRYPQIQVDINSINILTSNYINTGISKTLGTLNVGIEIATMQKKGMPVNVAMTQFESFRVNVDKYYNKESNYLRFLWPGVTGGILQQIFLLVLALIFAKEFEKKTFHQLFSYPKSTWMIMIGKTLPYIFIMMAMWMGILYIMYPLFKIDLIGNFWAIFVFSLLFLLSLLFMGVLASLIFPTMLSATETLMLIATPSFIVSGYTWPISQMPVVMQYIANTLPLTHFLSGFRKIVFMGNTLGDVLPEIKALIIILTITAIISFIILKFRIKKELSLLTLTKS